MAIVKKNYKIVLTTVGLFLVGILLAFLLEDIYRQFVRASFKFFQGDKIQFIGKNFHLFASETFVIGFGLFAASTYLLLYHSSTYSRLKKFCETIILCFTTIIFITAIDCERLIVECTACNDGIRKLTYNQITYDRYFIISLSAGLLYLIFVFLRERKRPLEASH